ncbi:hypothetical protein ACLB2K_036336 [Fragaria x ananassa]
MKCYNNPASPEYRPHFGEARNANVLSPECQLCNKMGHTAINCPLRNSSSSLDGNTVLACQICGIKGHIALDCGQRNNYAFQGTNPPSNLTVMTAHSNGRADIRNLSIAQPFESQKSITIGNGEGQSVKSFVIPRKE